jgi:hypothetical protein
MARAVVHLMIRSAMGIGHYRQARTHSSERDHVSRPARLAVRPHEIVGMFIGRNGGYRRNAEHGKSGCPPDDPIPATHRAPPAASENSVVSAMSIM